MPSDPHLSMLVHEWEAGVRAGNPRDVLDALMRRVLDYAYDLGKEDARSPYRGGSR